MTTLGRYQILEKIGSGSMGTVYRAKDTTLDREIALKTIRTGAEVEPELRERFYREARACARLQHPNIIIVHDLGEVDQIAFIAMELLEGRDLRKVITEREQIPVVVKLEIMVQICDALAYAHSRGIIHRDVKPSNLFLVGADLAKVLDFGIARLPSSHLTVAGRILGTPNYMAPEQIQGKPSDARSDLFSAAVVFFELLAYAHPFKSQSIPRRILENEPDSLFDYDSKLPVLLESVFARALAKDPAQRYQHGEDLGADLRAIAEAMRHNASPTFSAVQLPSARDFAIIPALAPHPFPADLSLLQPVPAGEDPYEWRFSEVLRLIPEFEQALDAGNIGRAQTIVAQLEAIEAVDTRFGDAVDLCRKRLLDPPQAVKPVPVPAPPPSEATEQRKSPATTDSGVPKYCPTCGTPNRRPAQFCISCGSSFPDQSSMETFQRPQPTSPPAVYQPPQNIAPVLSPIVKPSAPTEKTTLFKVPTFEPAPPVREPVSHPPVIAPTPPAGNPASWTARRKQIVFGGAAIAVLILIGLLAVFLRPEPVQPAVAFAFVLPPRTVLYKQPGKSDIVTLSRGDRVAVLRLPTPRDREWAQVQFVSPQKVFHPGYVRTADLERWDSANADSALALIRMFAPPDSASEAEVDSRIQSLGNLIQRFSQSHAASLAHIEIASLEMALINRKRAAGEPPAAWTGRMDEIRTQLNAAGAAAEVNAAKEELQRYLAALTAEVDSTANKPVVPPIPSSSALRDNMNQLLEQARSLWRDSRYEEAQAALERVLRLQPANPDALALQKKIKSAMDLEKSTIR